jgi:hypothetical protein
LVGIALFGCELWIWRGVSDVGGVGAPLHEGVFYLARNYGTILHYSDQMMAKKLKY